MKNTIAERVADFLRQFPPFELLKQDNYSFDEITDAYMLDVSGRHNAVGDAFITAIIFLKITGILVNEKKLSLIQLFKL